MNCRALLSDKVMRWQGFEVQSFEQCCLIILNQESASMLMFFNGFFIVKQIIPHASMSIHSLSSSLPLYINYIVMTAPEVLNYSANYWVGLL